MKLFQGQRIRCRGEEWQVVRADSRALVNGHEVWEVTAKGLSGIARGIDFCFMSDLDMIELIDPSHVVPELDKSSGGIKTKLHLEAHLRRLLPRNGALYLGQHGAVEPFEYQLAPAAKGLHLMRPRILIGDAVGLGKTIECGILLSELIRRGKANRVLCAVPKSVLEQFQTEMWGRFSIPFHRLDSKGLQKLKQDLPSTMNPFYHFDKIMISIDTLKIKSYQKLLEECQWDVLIVDECHNVADRTDGGGGSARHRVIKRIADRSNAVVLMSATPHDGTREGFASLIKLLDRTRIKSDADYKPEDFKDHFIRRTRTQVAAELTQRGARIQKTVRIPLTAKEIDILQSIHDGERRTTLLKKMSRGVEELFKTTLIKSFLSSPAALKATAEAKMKTLERSIKAPDADSEKLKAFLQDLIEDIDQVGEFSRFKQLAEIIKLSRPSDHDRLVIFTERVPTMKAIEEYLLKSGLVSGKYDPSLEPPQQGNLVATVNGSLPDYEINAIVKAFQSNKHSVNILVATNVASEGLNLHFNCHRLIHFDLPWSLITLEQRNGRIDRLGQTKQPEITYFASVAVNDSKETKAKDLKDDFWIVEKIENRIKIAAQDMDEEALNRFLSNDQEETENTRIYESGESQLQQENSFDLSHLFLANNDKTSGEELNIYRKKLPSLFSTSPSEFVEGVCDIAKIEHLKTRTNSLKIDVSSHLRLDANSWPREFQPKETMLELEQHPGLMEAHYKEQLNLGARLEKTFMNEIHPFLGLLENTALGLYKGDSLPTFYTRVGDVGSIHYLVQATLFNQCNDIVMQYWQAITARKGSNILHSLVKMQSSAHVQEVSDWLTSGINGLRRKASIDEATLARIQKLAPSVVTEMRRLTEECRSGRGENLRDQLKDELKRIKTWEKDRKKFLSNITENSDLASHAGMFATVSKAQHELNTLDEDSRRYNEFINNYFRTSDAADIRILGCLISCE